MMKPGTPVRGGTCHLERYSTFLTTCQRAQNQQLVEALARVNPGPNSSLESYLSTVSCSGTPMAPPPATYRVYGNRQTDEECYLGHPQVQQEQAQLVDWC